MICQYRCLRVGLLQLHSRQLLLLRRPNLGPSRALRGGDPAATGRGQRPTFCDNLAPCRGGYRLGLSSLREAAGTHASEHLNRAVNAVPFIFELLDDVVDCHRRGL